MSADQPAFEVAFEPDREFVESTNVWAFMQAHDIDSYGELIERTTSDLDWFWGEVVEYLGLEFYEDFETVRDATDGPQFTDWYPGGTLNVAHNTVDRHASTDAGTRNHVACIWEGEPGEVREMTFHDLHREANQVANALVARGI
ncbi:MAG: acetyl-coenzyme A synthetase N-terminal domain-containing protein, partial [Halodesulfurarchaeum sp.]